MDREILFRAKATNRIEGFNYRTDYKNGDWVYGLVSDMQNFYGYTQMTNTDGVSGIDVNKKTIGQFTGLCDKNGKKIFEGDIVGLFCNTQIFEVKWCDIRGGYFLDSVIMGGGCEPCPECLGNLTDTIEVIGNIHDNPELLN